MCGITGYFSYNAQPVQRPILQRMTDQLAHRGPDGEGFWIDEKQSLGFGHRRLSIIDLSDRGRQPMHYGNGRYTITFNGEIYNYLELKAELEQKGYVFSSDSDTEVLLALYADRGPECLQAIDGMFAFALWDAREEQLFCARDRFGEKPFFYAHNSSRFVFGSEMKALFASGLVRPEVRRDKLFQYLVYDTVQSVQAPEATFFKDIFQLRPAHYLIVNREGQLRETRYWSVDRAPCQDNLDTAAEKVQDLLKLSISRRLRSDVPVGSSLSGGLDSSAIVLLIDAIKGQDQVQRTFSARFQNFAKDEGAYMQAVIDRCRVEPHFTWPDEGVLTDQIDRIFWHQEEPFGSASIVVQDQVMALARENGTIVLLDGQGPDEMLGGYHFFYFKYYLKDLYRSDRTKFETERRAFEEITGIKVSADLELAFRAAFPTLVNRVKGLPKKAAPFLYPKISGLHPSMWPYLYTTPDPYVQRDSVSDQLKLATFDMGLPALLRFADRNSMAHSVEVRLPYLSHELAEYLFSLPIEMKLFQGWTKYILRKAMAPLLPDMIAWRRDKIGYEPPQQRWLESAPMKEKVRQAITLLQQENILRKPVKGLEWRYLMAAGLLNFAKRF
ncbi:MAG: Asparagine synthetase [glutamine-hydrolyzing] 3 [Haliscomenobacter sp.]|jgi:asparagine synthase (glutamine-hydrolysing)|nr:Asparagine synthetase [glutamine-hydrolyzing] 3 [Haliscomenobacter sp.]